MKHRLISFSLAFAFAFAFAANAHSEQQAGDTGVPVGNSFGWVPNSTNALNKAKQTPGRIGQNAHYVEFVSNAPGTVTLRFVNPTAFAAYFERRPDLVPSQYLPNVYAHPVVTGDLYFHYTKVDAGTETTLTLPVAEFVDIRSAFGPERDFDFDWTRFYALPVEALTCTGFQPPMDKVVSIKKKSNRVLPFKMQIADADGVVQTANDIAAPVIQVVFNSEVFGGVDGDDLLSSGKGDEGNQFVYDSATQAWQFNLNSRQFTAAGTYVVTAVSGDGDAYLLNGCEAIFIIE